MSEYPLPEDSIPEDLKKLLETLAGEDYAYQLIRAADKELHEIEKKCEDELHFPVVYLKNSITKDTFYVCPKCYKKWLEQQPEALRKVYREEIYFPLRNGELLENEEGRSEEDTE